MDIGKRITYLRTEKNYSVNKLANLAGISQSYLRDIELGNKNPTVELLSKIYSLTPPQRKALLTFLDTMTK